MSFLCISAIALFAFIAQTAFAQSDKDLFSPGFPGGTQYYIAFPDTITNTFDPRFPPWTLGSSWFEVIVYSPLEQTVDIGRVNGQKVREHIGAGQTKSFNLAEVGIPIVTEVNTPTNTVISLTAEYPVVVYAYMGTAFGAAAFTPLPVSSWGQEYYAATWPGEVVKDKEKAVRQEAPAEILIIAAKDNTRVSIRSTAVLRECAGCNTVELNAGEAYLVQSVVDTSEDAERFDDLVGTEISANKPIGVISGNTRIRHYPIQEKGVTGNSARDLVAEWLPPLELLGTEFVFTPTWDDRRQRGELPSEESRDAEYVRIIGASPGTTSVSWINELGMAAPATTPQILPRDFTHEVIRMPVARTFHATKPALAVASPNSVLYRNGEGNAGDQNVSYSAWATYMVELVPRERWSSFAPVRVPSWPVVGMSHYLNLVADSSDARNIFVGREGIPFQAFDFNRGYVPGTRFVWGTIELNSLATGGTYEIRGENGARFTGHVYGMLNGNEIDRNSTEYEEDVALSYGYPLASSFCIPGDPDEYLIETSDNCGEMVVDITALNNDPTGLSSLRLLADSSENLRLEFISPASPLDIRGSGNVLVRLVPIDPNKEASGVLVFTDRTCGSRRWRVEYQKSGTDIVDLSPGELLHFGEVQPDVPAGEREVLITNPLNKPVTVKRLGFLLGDQNFAITQTRPIFDWQSGQGSLVLMPGDSLVVSVDITPKQGDGAYRDSLVVDMECGRTLLGVQAVVGVPCVLVSDINFGDIEIGKTISGTLRICNGGGGELTFKDPYLTWVSSAFNVDPADIALLADAVLGPGECVSINVSFVPESPGPANTRATVWINENTSGCDDESLWSAHVVDTTTGVTGEAELAGYRMAGVVPNPTDGDVHVSFSLGKGGATTVDIYNAEGRHLERLLEDNLHAGEHRLLLSRSGLPAGAYHIRIRSGAWTGVARVVIQR